MLQGKSWSVFRRKWIKISHVECWKVKPKHGQSKEYAMECDIRRLLWLNMLWTVQGLDLAGIRIDDAGVCSLSLWSELLFCKCKQQQGHPWYHCRGEQAQSPRQVLFPRLIQCFAQLFTHHRAGLASLKGQSAALQCIANCHFRARVATSWPVRTLVWLPSALESCLAKDFFCHLCHGEEKFLGVTPSSQLLPAAGAVQFAVYTGAEGFFFLSQPSNL